MKLVDVQAFINAPGKSAPVILAQARIQGKRFGLRLLDPRFREDDIEAMISRPEQ